MNPRENTYSRIAQYHEAGFTGRGVKAAFHEVNPKVNPDLYGTNLVIAPQFASCIDRSYTKSHAMDVIDSFLEILPDAEIHILGASPRENLRYCLANGIKLYNMSTSGYWYNPEDNAAEQEFIDTGGILICCAGNSSAGGLWDSPKKPNFISVGAVRMLEDGRVIRTSYSSYTPGTTYLDIMQFGDLLLRSGYEQGTSFAAPRALAMIGAWMESQNAPVYLSDVEAMIRANCVDIEDTGYDSYTGYGVFIMPEVEEITRVIEVTIGSTAATIDGQPVTLLIAPQVVEGRTMLGIRDMANLLGASLTLSGQKITLTLED